MDKIDVLIVEDDRNEREALQEQLEDEGISTTAVRGLEEATEWLKHPEQRRDLKLVVLDLMFPPSKRPPSLSDLYNLTPGIRFYEEELRGKYNVMVLTGALRFTKLRPKISEIVAKDKQATLTLKPEDPDVVIEKIRECLSKGEWR